jgi:hypothetical protein
LFPLVASPSVSELAVSEASELVTFVRFGVISVGVIKDEWLLVIQLDKKIGYILEVVDIA